LHFALLALKEKSCCTSLTTRYSNQDFQADTANADLVAKNATAYCFPANFNFKSGSLRYIFNENYSSKNKEST